MKKLICVLLLLSFLTSVFAIEIIPSKRFFEIGLNADAGLSNNCFSIGDFLQKEVVLDFNKIADSLGSNGIKLNLGTDVDFHITIGNRKTWFTSFFVNVDVSGYSTVPKMLVELISNGNKIDEPLTDSVGLGASAYATIGASFGSKMKIGKDEYEPERIKSLTFKVTPEFFVPIVYVPNPNNAFTFLASSNGAIKANGYATVDVYTPFSLENGLDPQALSSVFSCGGLDLSAEFQYPFKFFDLGIKITHLPLKSAKLNYTTRVKIEASAEIEKDGVLGHFVNKTENSESSQEEEESFVNTQYTMSEEPEYLEEENSIQRPFKLGAYAVFRPLKSNILIIAPEMSIKINDPFSEYTGLFNTKGFDIDFGCVIESHLAKLLWLRLDMMKEDAVWKQKFSVALNFRLLEIDVMIGGESSNFLKSFSGSGVTAGIGLKLGL